MKRLSVLFGIVALSISSFAHAAAGYIETLDVFKKAGASAAFFKTAYAYAVFSIMGEGGFMVGAAIGKGRV